ncbi:MAG: YbaB/EbfC family nucleoid-associated protein [Candidatus Uhrbacteria bacterium]
MFNKIKAIKDMRTQAKKLQNGLAEITAEGEAAWGKVKIKIDGNQQILEVKIDEELLKDKNKLQDAIKEATNDAVKKIQRQMAFKMKELGGLDALKNLGL